jgi:UDP-N-acetylmuramyl tripeptide synthase
MKKIKFFVALYAAKSAQLLMKLLGRNATYLPGKVAVKICRDFLAHLTPPKTVIAVTGTNGKTTVSNLIASILSDNGFSVTNNSFGSNVQAGVISALIADSRLSGKPKKDIAVLEVDERSSLLIYPYLAPDFLICNNIMRDSLKRNAHTEFIRYIIDSALPKSTKLVLNADDLNTALLGTSGQEKVFFSIEADIPDTNEQQYIRDIVYCPVCGEPLVADYVRYNHIGRHHCSSCTLKSPAPNYSVTMIDREKNEFTVSSSHGEMTFNLINDNIVNIYNFVAVVSILDLIGLSADQIAKGFSAAKIVKTRLDEISIGEHIITMLMAKGQNPIACARCYDYVAKAAGDKKGVIILVDDKDDNIENSESTCWLYDCDYRALADPSINQIVFAGPRCKDHYLRAMMAGVDEEKIKIVPDSSQGAKLFDIACSNNIYVLHELYRPTDAAVVKNTLIERIKGMV